MSIRRTGSPVWILTVSALGALSLACSDGSSEDSSTTGGVATATGGASNGTGGAPSSGGVTSGGTQASGGTLERGGSSHSGGASASGGSSVSGGAAGASFGGRAAGGSGSGGGPNPNGGVTLNAGGAWGGQIASGGEVTSGGQIASGGEVTSGGQSTSGGQGASGGPVTSGGQGDAGSQVTSGGQGDAGSQSSSGGQDASGGGAGSAGDTASGGAAGASCPSPAIAPGSPTREIQIGGRTRTYVLYVPSGYTGDQPVPLLVDFHPHGGTGPNWRNDSPYVNVVGDNVIIAFPSAVGDWNVGPCCADDVDDVEFARAMVDEIQGLACIDPKRIYAAGFSMGGGMTNYVACHASDLFAAFAPAAFDLLEEVVPDCTPSRPITVVAFRGTDDEYVPYEGGLSDLVRPIHFLGAVNTMNKWAELNGCTGSAADLGDGCQGYATAQCPDEVEVVLCTKQGGGHEAANANLTWPVLERHAMP